MNSITNDNVYLKHTTADKAAIFEFRFVNLGHYYEIDIMAMPDYGSLPDDLYLTHRKPSRRGGYLISIRNEFDVCRLSQAKQMAMLWAEKTWRYIKEGVSF